MQASFIADNEPSSTSVVATTSVASITSKPISNSKHEDTKLDNLYFLFQ